MGARKASGLADPFADGVGASGVDFFAVAGIDDAARRRDLIVLQGLASALDLLAGEDYAEVFDAETSLPGGQSAVPGSRFYQNLLERWLTNETHPLRQSLAELAGNVVSVENFSPARLSF